MYCNLYVTFLFQRKTAKVVSNGLLLGKIIFFRRKRLPKEKIEYVKISFSQKVIRLNTPLYGRALISKVLIAVTEERNFQAGDRKTNISTM